MFHIKPLEWETTGPDDDGDQQWVANTPFGFLKVMVLSGSWYWEYCFDEYYDEDRRPCDSLEDGKDKAWCHWVEKLRPALAP